MTTETSPLKAGDPVIVRLSGIPFTCEFVKLKSDGRGDIQAVVIVKAFEINGSVFPAEADGSALTVSAAALAG